MARINLLPWRQELRAQKNKEFNLLAAATAILAVLIVLLAMTFLNSVLSSQQNANTRISSEITNLEAVIVDIEGLEKQREEMLARLKVIQDLQGQRSVPVRLWDDIARAVPSTMYLVGMKREGSLITLTGFADSANTVSQLARNLDSSPWLSNSTVPSIQAATQVIGGANNTQINAPERNYINFIVTTQVQSEAGAGSEEPAAMDLQPIMSEGNPAVAPTDPNAVAPEATTQPTQQPATPVASQPSATTQPVVTSSGGQS